MSTLSQLFIPMLTTLKTLPRNLYFFAIRKSKRVFELQPEVITFQDNLSEIMADNISESQKNKQKFKELQRGISEIPPGWQTMNFHQLCSLKPLVLRALEIEVKKQKFTSSQQMFNLFTNEDPEDSLNQYWLHIYKLFNNEVSVNNDYLKTKQQTGYQSQMFVYNIEDDLLLKKTIGDFIKKIKEPKKLEGIAEPTFCKYLLSLKRDLALRGIKVEDINEFSSVKLLKVLNYEYEFWVDVLHNRAKNGTQERFIVERRTIDNPNDTIILRQESPKIDVKYIVRKKKRRQIEKCFCIKMDVLIQVGYHQHIVKVQWKGPTDKTLQEAEQRSYLVIDYDNIFNGNPTIKPVFQF